MFIDVAAGTNTYADNTGSGTAIGQGGGAGPVSTNSASFTATQDQNGLVFTNIASAANMIVTIPVGLSIGTTYNFIADNASFTLQGKFSGSELIHYAGTSSTAGGTITWAAGSVGGSVFMKKISSTVWVAIAAAGSGATLA